MPPKSLVWEHFHTTELETTYIHKATNKSRLDKLINQEPFTTVEAQSFQRIFHDLPGIELPIKSASTVKRRLVVRFEESRENLKRELDSTCITIG
ncbi:hypothetical protein V1524DRAFT_431330, partial [Lipomyces starkeyi]